MKTIWKIIIIIQSIIILSFMIIYLCSDNTEEIITDNIQIISTEYNESKLIPRYINKNLLFYYSDEEYIVKILYEGKEIKIDNEEIYEIAKDHVCETILADIRINTNPKLRIEKVTIDKVYNNKEEAK